MKKTILFAASVFAAMSVWAESTVVDGVTWYYTKEYSGYCWNSSSQQYVYSITNATITSGADKYAGKLTIPSSLDGYTVTRIGGYAFQNCSGLMDIAIPNTVVSIDYDSFYGCTGLTSVVLPDSVTYLGSCCFCNCSALKSVALSSQLTSLSGSCFSGCSSLASIELPAGVTSIGGDAFSGCTSLADVALPEGMVSIGGGAFRNCASLADIALPAGLTLIGDVAFDNCKSFTRLDIPPSVESIGTHMIRGCDKLKTITVAKGNVNCKVENNCLVSKSGSTLLAVPFGCEEVDIPDGVTSIPNYMFDNDDNLVRVTIPVGVASIGSCAFCDCDSLLSVEIPAECTMIGSYAFSGCDTLTQVSLPEGLTTIGNDAFNSCKLTEVILPASVTSVGSSAFGDGNYTTRKVVFLGAPPSGVVNSYLLSAKDISYPREYGAQWLAILNDVSKFNGYNQSGKPEVEYVSVAVRANDPAILDCVYKVKSAQPTVKVRALAFQDGERSFSKVVRPETFVADTNGVETAGNVGDAIVPNVPHTISWRVSSDWSNRLAKVSFEVLATEGELLPFEVRTIPASDAYGKMDVTWNTISESQWFDALLWLYADKCEKMSVRDGVCFYDGKMTASGTTLNYNKTASSYYSRTYNSETKQYDYVRYINTPEAVLDAMGYNVLSGDVLNYVNEETRLGLSPSGYRQYGYKIVSEK